MVEKLDVYLLFYFYQRGIAASHNYISMEQGLHLCLPRKGMSHHTIEMKPMTTCVNERNILLPQLFEGPKLPNFDPAVKPKWGEDCAHQRRWLAENHVPPSDKENEDDSACQYILCYP
ncbi:hypothetical protein KSC_001960 [Ktedonobacter sp. SOSP1-52]|nr:hypothetical protein KSC_001960 [Ktedonobacter sp. SOSP1-52]